MIVLQYFLGFHEGFTPTSGGADPEEADNMELGMRYIQGSTFVELVYFDTDYQNMFGSWYRIWRSCRRM